MQAILEVITTIARSAGKEILEVYQEAAVEVEKKSDDSPITVADRRSHQLILHQLQAHFPDIPVISEEAPAIPYEQRQQWSFFWLVDPLDGTKEFINRNGEFTVNIALLHQAIPVAGVVYAPALQTMYWGAQGYGAWKQQGGQIVNLLRQTPEEHHDGLIAVGSRSHAKPEEEQVLQQLGITEIRRIGSALKFCLVAEKRADLYYRASPVWEWDTAAGHAILNAIGGMVLSRGQPLRYNTPDLKHTNGFVCVWNPALLDRYPLLKTL